jgi:hypothetical protein
VINGGFDEISKINEILDPLNQIRAEAKAGVLEGCMAGRLAMNSPWELARIDREVFGDMDFNTMTREAILRDYAEFVAIE